MAGEGYSAVVLVVIRAAQQVGGVVNLQLRFPTWLLVEAATTEEGSEYQGLA